MKYTIDDYLNCEFYGAQGNEEITHYNCKIIKCRKEQKCVTCEQIIQAGNNIMRETGFWDNKPVSCYTCISCLDKWLDEHKPQEDISI